MLVVQSPARPLLSGRPMAEAVRRPYRTPRSSAINPVWVVDGLTDVGADLHRHPELLVLFVQYWQGNTPAVCYLILYRLYPCFLPLKVSMYTITLYLNYLFFNR